MRDNNLFNKKIKLAHLDIQLFFYVWSEFLHFSHVCGFVNGCGWLCVRMCVFIRVIHAWALQF